MTRTVDSRPERAARILVVDDEPLNVDYLEQELESHGFVTEAAANGTEALERVAANPPDLVLLDVMMPGMDGISALRILKGDPETRLIPVVLMTALNAVEDRVRGIEAGADDFLSKPIDERELLARMRTALSLKRSIDATLGELRSTSEYLARYGRQERDVAVLVVDWRLRDASLPDEAADFVGRRRREAAGERIRALGGMPAESETGPLVAVFDAPELRTRSIAAVEAALVVLRDSWADPDGAVPMAVHAAVGVGPALVGSMRVAGPEGLQWIYGAEGAPVEQAAELVYAATDDGVLLAAEAGAVVSDRFVLEPAGEQVYRVVSTAAQGEPDAAGPQHDRCIRTILITDIVDSTRTVERVGDRAWIDLLVAHDRAMRSELVVYGGEEVDTTGDGFVASFESPARAVRCALATMERVSKLGLTIRAGLHTGEVEQVGETTSGIALHVASRIAARANGGEVLVSATTRELAAGSGLVFADRGEHTLKGVSEPRRLYAAGVTQVVEADGADYPAGLTEREVEVLRLVAVGLSDAEAARRLFLSVRTVNAHLRSVYRKVGVRSRAAAVRFAVENGLL
jgi:DNA-binding NarL/FixJ family response regulator